MLSPHSFLDFNNLEALNHITSILAICRAILKVPEIMVRQENINFALFIVRVVLTIPEHSHNFGISYIVNL